MKAKAKLAERKVKRTLEVWIAKIPGANWPLAVDADEREIQQYKNDRYLVTKGVLTWEE
jgi:hypothetical protein